MTPPRWLPVAIMIVALLLALLLTAHKALAQPVCGSPDKIVAALVRDGNKLAADMQILTETGLVPMQIFVNPSTDKWVMVIETEAGACAIMMGEKWAPARLPGTDI